MYSTCEPDSADPSVVRRCVLASRGASWVVGVSGALVLIGWLWRIPALMSILPHSVTMKANTALAFTLAGLSLGLLRVSPGKSATRTFNWRTLGLVFGGLVAAIGALTLSEYVFAWDLGIDQLLFQDNAAAILTSHPGRMAPATAFGFIFAGLALVLLDVESKRGWRPAQGLSFIPCVVGILSLLAYAYEAGTLYRLAAFTSVAFLTAVLFVILAAGILCVHPTRGLMSIATSSLNGGPIARRAVFLAFTIPPILAWLRLLGERAGLYGMEFGLAILVTCTISIFTALILLGARFLNRSDAERREASESLQRANSRLEQYAAERTSELDLAKIRLQQVLNAATQVSVIATDTDGLITVFNAGAEKMLGYTAVEMVGLQSPAILHVLSEVVAHGRTLSEAFGRPIEGFDVFVERARNGEYEEREWTYVRKDGSTLAVSLAVTAMHGAGGKINGFLGMAVDITEGKAARAALEEAAQRLQLATHVTGTGVWDWDVVTNRLVWDQQMFALYGIDQPPAEMVYSIWADTVFPEDLPEQEAILRETVLRHGQSERKFRIRRRNDGEIRIIHAAEMTISDGTGGAQRVVGINRDVTDLELAAANLAASEEHFRQAFEFAGTGMAIVGLDGAWLQLNRTMCEIIGYTEAELLQKTFLDVTHPDDLAIDLDQVKDLVDGRANHYRIEKRYLHRDGHSVWIHLTASLVRDQSGAPLHFVSQIEDISARKRAEHALREIQQFQQAVFKGISHGIHGVDLSGKIIFENPAAAEMLGWEIEDLLGKPAHATIHHHHADCSVYPVEECGIYATLRDGAFRRVSDDTFWRKDGSAFPVEYCVAPMRDQAGAITGAIVVFIDITARKKADEELRSAKDKAEEANRAKSRFLANVSHEIRTPMNGVIGMTSLLMDTPLNEEQRDCARTIRLSAENLLTVINDILDFSKVEAGRIVLETFDFDLQELLEETLELFAEGAHAKGLELAGCIAPEAPRRLRGDAGRLRQVLTNLIGNAIKFTARGGVAVRIGANGVTGAYATMAFRVQDTGIGIAPETQGRLFDAFTQADVSTTRKYGGTGLGLAISKQLVELMGGHIGIESAAGQGAVFWFHIPLQIQRDAPHDPAAEHALSGMRVLIVDDNASSADCLQAQLAGWKVPSVIASNGLAALERLRETARGTDPFTTVILDLTMPEMEGLALARTIAADAALEGVRLILLTTRGHRLSTETWRAAGISQCCAKPVRQSALYDCLANSTAGGPAPFQNEGTAAPEHTPARMILNPNVHRILVAEDNSVNQKVTLGQLRKLGYAADAVANGFEVLQAIDRVPYDIVLMDCQMPEMDGYEATAAIRQREEGKGHTWIIAMTANAMNGDREKCLAAGMDDYVSKPVRTNDLAAALASAHVPEGHTPVIDPECIAELRGLPGESGEQLFSNMVSMFREDGPQTLANLRAALDGGDGSAVTRFAHTIKGSAGYFGARPFQQICHEMESASRAGNLEPVGKLLASAEQELHRVVAALDTELNLQTI